MRLLLVIVAILAVTGCSVRFDSDEVPAVRTFPFTGAELKITSSLGGVRVLPATSPAVEVRRWTRGKASTSPSWSLRDGVLRLSADCTLIVGDCGARYHVRVPAGVRLTVDSPDGVILNGLTQDVDVSSGDRIEVKDTSGKLRLLTDSGTIQGVGLRSPSVRGRTLDGSISLAFAAPPADLDLKSREGGVTVRVPKDSYQVKVESADGSEHSDIKSTKSSSRTILARSTYGNVRVLTR
ncbi:MULTISPECIES: DUF4097 family beta strand repeat-containing protein [unclassified Nonomuraea]|uniref:DUF4097 family beta strand repeat-containing protein n=1 Tax=unclassified Nonomuraea TaxID=2593643 RepID=UPI0033FE06AC